MKNYDWLQSVYSDGSKFFVSNPYPKSGEEISIKLRVASNPDLDHVLLKSKEHGSEKFYLMKLVETKNGLDYYETEVRVSESIFHYHFYLVVGDEVFYYSQYHMQDYLVDETRDFKILVNYDAPVWVKSSVFYQILPDRFKNSRSHLDVQPGEYTLAGEETTAYESWDEPGLEYDQGKNVDFYNGDLYGIIEELDYIEALGVNAIYLNPIFYSPSTHKFDTLDFFQVDPHLGGDEAFAELMDELHVREMKLVLDVSIDHTSSDAKWFNKDLVFYPQSVGAYHNPNSKEREYFSFFEDGTYETWAGVETMPKINYESEAARDILYRDDDSVVKYWMSEPYSIDGWRFDVSDVMAHDKDLDLYYEVWQEIYDEIKRKNLDAMILAEDWGDGTELFHQNGFDSTMNYFGFTRPMREFLGEKDLFSGRNEILNSINSSLNANQLKNRMAQALSLVPYQISLQQFNLLNSHDISRIYSNPDVSHQEYLGAVTMLFTFPGTPNIYYGDEKMLYGSFGSSEGARYSMDWNEITDPIKQENYNRYKVLAHLKQTESALIDGSTQFVFAEDRIMVYARFSDIKTYLVVFSGQSTEEEISINLPYLGYNSKSEIKEVFSENLEYFFEGEIMRLSVPAHHSYLIELN